MIRGGARARVDVHRAVEPPARLRGTADVGLFASLQPGLFCVDGNNLLWRAAHGHPAPFTASDGRDLTPLFRFFSLLRRALGTHGLFAECVVCFDGAEAWGERLDLHGGYKAHRDYSAADLSFMAWLPEIRAALDGCGVANVELNDHEADDVIATLAAKAGRRTVRILSTDRDYYQLISSTVAVVNPRTRPAVVDADLVVQRYGVAPHQWCDFRALTGDASDGIPGVPGIGPVRAAAMLAGGRRLEDLDGDIQDAHRSDARRWRELIRLRTDVPVGLELAGEPTQRLPAATAVCSELGLVNVPAPIRRTRL